MQTLASKLWGGLNSTAAACAAVAAAGGMRAYDLLITKPLRIFYFVGPVWGDLPAEEICSRMTGVAAQWWKETPDRMEQCAGLTGRQFHSFDAGVMTSVYFAALTFAVLQLTCNCFCVRPIVRALAFRRG